jgi:hypothetical protein
MRYGIGNIHWHQKGRGRQPCLLGVRSPECVSDQHFGSKCLQCGQQRRWSAWGKQTLVSGRSRDTNVGEYELLAPIGLVWLNDGL